jgi:hypothetical protein
MALSTGSGVSTFSKPRRRYSYFQTNAEFNTRRPHVVINPIGKWAVDLAYGPPKRMKMIGGPLKPFFGLSGVHFQVAGNHFRRSELGFNQYPVPKGRLTLAQHEVLGLRSQKRVVPKGRLKNRRTSSCGTSADL